MKVNGGTDSPSRRSWVHFVSRAQLQKKVNNKKKKRNKSKCVHNNFAVSGESMSHSDYLFHILWIGLKFVRLLKEKENINR